MTGGTSAKSDRLTTDAYFATALRVLGELGSDGLTVHTLCDRLAVTKGSFYHHFDGLPSFVTGLLAHWEAEHSARLIEAVNGSEPSERRTMIIAYAIDLPHAPEAALRAWARSNAEVAQVVTRVDRQRERHVTQTLIADGLTQEKAQLYGRMALDALVGQQMREKRLNRARLRRTLEELSRLVFAELP